MKPLFIVLVFSCFTCHPTKVGKDQESTKALEIEPRLSSLTPILTQNFDLKKHLENYSALKKSILSEKKNYVLNEKSRKMFSVFLYDSIFPYWKGTKWDFNGITEKPRDGKIACGYFVSTTLRDMGMKINRYKIAQKASSDIIKSFTDSKHIKQFKASKDALSHLSELKEGEVCIVGLDYHVGFLTRKDNRTYFTHSTFVGPSCVVNEIADSSSVFLNSDIYVIGQLNGSDTFMKKWLN